MKRGIVTILVLSLVLIPCMVYAQTPQQVDYMKLEVKAKQDAEGDVTVNKAFWGIGAFFAFFLLSPAGGAAAIITANTIPGDVSVPAERIGEIEQMYPGNHLALKAYKDQYVETYKSLKKKGQVKAAWAGCGAACVAVGVLIMKAGGL